MPSRKEYTGISPEVWQSVKERDRRNGWVCCVFCGRPAYDEAGNGLEVHHYVHRSLGGMGVEENLVNLCPQCHRQVHSGDELINEFLREYLSVYYEDWDEEKLIWRKQW